MPDQILFITSNRLGDAVLSMGLIDHMIRTYPDKKITVACGPLAASLFEGCPQVTNIIPLKKLKRAGHWIALWKQVVKTRWFMVVDLRNSAVSRLLFSRQRYIYGKHIAKDQHKTAQNAAVMQLDYVPAPRLWPSDWQMSQAKALIGSEKPVLALGPAANWIGKTWPADRFIALIKTITAKDGILPGAALAVFGAPGEEEICYRVLHSVPKDRQIDVIAKADPGTAAAALSLCDLYVGNDSGLMHCAAAAGIPTFGLFGPSYDLWYAPYGPQTAYIRTPETFDELIDFEGYDPVTLDRTLMTSLKTEDVLEALQQFWSGLKY